MVGDLLEQTGWTTPLAGAGLAAHQVTLLSLSNLQLDAWNNWKANKIVR